MFETFNQFEAVFWAAIGLVFLGAGIRRSTRKRSRCFVLAAAFVAFGLSDLVEAQTGA